MSLFIEDVNSWVRGSHEFRKHRTAMNSNDSTVYQYNASPSALCDTLMDDRQHPLLTLLPSAVNIHVTASL
jgi:hypothetical protein